MRLLTRALTVISMLGGMTAGTQVLAEPFKVGVCYDLSKAYTFATPQVSQAALDLAKLINKKGGIGGEPVEVIVRDHGNEPQRGIECYSRLSREGVFVFDTLSTPVSLAILPRAMEDGRILMQSLVGRGDAVDGTVFDWVYPIGPTYWGQAANDVAYIKQLHDGDLSDVKVGFVYFDYPFGQEPIEILQTLSEKEGFELELYPVPLPGSDQAGVWSKVRRDKPDHVIVWMLGGAHVVASKEMQRNRIPMEKYISVNWLNEVDIANIGNEAAIGLKRGTNVVGGQDVALRQEMITELYDKERAPAHWRKQRTFSTIPGWRCIRSYSRLLAGRRRPRAFRSRRSPTRRLWRRSKIMTPTD